MNLEESHRRLEELRRRRKELEKRLEEILGEKPWEEPPLPFSLPPAGNFYQSETVSRPIGIVATGIRVFLHIIILLIIIGTIWLSAFKFGKVG